MRILIADDSGSLPETLRSLFQRVFDRGHEQSDASKLLVSVLSKLQLGGSGDGGDGCNDKFGDLKVDLGDQPELSSTILDSIGLALLHRGRVEEGRPLIEAALRIRSEFFGEDHPATAASFNSRARVLRQLGNYKAAETEARKALGINSRVYGGDSLPVAITLNELGVIQLQLGDFAAAEQSALAGLNILKALRLECTDPNVTRLMDTLGRVQQARGNYERATEHYLKLLDLDRRQVGDKHLKYATHLANFATVEQSAGQLKQASDDLQTAIRIMRDDVHRPRHPNVVDALSNLGSLLRAQGNLAGAGKVLKEALEMNIEIRGPDHTLIGNNHAGLGRVSYDAREFAAAAQSFRDALLIYGKNVTAGRLPDDHPYIAEAKVWLARTLVESGKAGAEEARRNAAEALDIWAGELGERSVEYAITNGVLGRSLYLIDNDSDEALERLRKSYPTVAAARGEHSPVARLIKGWLDEAESRN